MPTSGTGLICRAGLLLLVALPLRAQTPHPSIEEFLQRDIGLSPSQLQAIERGDVVTKLLPAVDRNEIAVFGAMTVAAPRRLCVDRIRDLRSFLAGRTRLTSGVFGDSATADDARTYHVDPDDAKPLRRCKYGDCKLKLSFAEMQRLQQQTDWSTPHPEVQVETWQRERMAGIVTAYRARGTAGMVEYDDTRGTVSAAGRLEVLLADSSHQIVSDGALRDYLRDYPKSTLVGATDAYYWATDRLPGLKPVTSVTHFTVYTPSDSQPMLIAAMQLYADHYFEASLDLTTLLDNPAHATAGSAPVPATVVFRLRRARIDDLPSGGLFNIRGRVMNKLRDALRDDMREEKEKLEN